MAAEFLEWVFTSSICDRIVDKELYDLYHSEDVPRYVWGPVANILLSSDNKEQAISKYLSSY